MEDVSRLLSTGSLSLQRVRKWTAISGVNQWDLIDFAHVLARSSDSLKKMFHFLEISKVRYFHRYLELEKVLGICDYLLLEFS